MNKDKGEVKGLNGWLKRFNGRFKDCGLLLVLGSIIVAAAWAVFHTDDKGNTIPVYATET